MDKNLLKQICAVNSPTGRETAICKFIEESIKDYVDECRVDALGNLIAVKKCGKPDAKKMMLAGHMDQIGLMVTHIDEKGFLWFSAVGGIGGFTSLHDRVIFSNGTVGVIGCERMDDQTKMRLDNMYIDIGAKDEADARKYVDIGDTCVYLAEPIIDETKIISPALDDRIGCFIMIEAAKKIKNPQYDIYYVFTVQEEVGLRGAKTSAYAVDPDYGICFDVTFSVDTPKALHFPMKMGNGACIKIKDASLLCHPMIIDHMEKAAKQHNIKHQREVLVGGGTDSGAIHVNKSGVPSGGISIATRYIHSGSEMCSLSDIEDCISLTVACLEMEIVG